MHDDFAANLRLLCSYYRSIAEVCRRLDINRPQFNRYLSGRYRPCDSIMRRICDFFGVEVHEILLPHDDFMPLIRLRPRPADEAGAETHKPHRSLSLPDTLLTQGSRGMSRYVGCYYEHYLSMSQPGKVLRTLVCLESREGSTLYQRTERMTSATDQRPYHNRYRGAALFLSDRIFMVDYESLNGHEVTQTILFPSFRSHVSRLTGLKLGVADSSERMPCCVRVVYERLGEPVNPRRALARCGLFELDDPELDPALVEAIRNDVGDDEWHFRARF